VPTVEFSKESLDAGVDIISLLSTTNIFSSKGEAKKMVQGSGVSINKIKTDDTNAIINSNQLLNNKYLLIQKGKRNYYFVIAG
jgi:tyrosyl-tRNA synthetase